ncbi:MAG: cell division protein ZapB [Nitrospirae bacterium]|nr:cell division protein ZapB [Nitrospirota bacterium]
MALDKMEALEARVRGLVELVQDLKRVNAALQVELRAARERLSKQEENNRRWEEERANIRSRINKVLGELDFLECMEESKEVALD